MTWIALTIAASFGIFAPRVGFLLLYLIAATMVWGHG